MTRFVIVAAILTSLASGPQAAEVSYDRLCRAIGDTPNVAIPPRDRAFFEDHCECLIGECAYKGGTRHRQLLAAVKCKIHVNEAATRELGYKVGPTDAVAGIADFRVFVEGLCLRDRSGPKVLATVRPAIDAQKRRDAASAEQKRKEEEEAAAKKKEEEEAAAKQVAAEAEKVRLAELSVYKPLREPAHAWPQDIRDMWSDGLMKGFSERYAGRRTMEQLRWQAGCIEWHLQDRVTLDELTTLSRDKARFAAVMDEISVGCKKMRPEGLGPDLAP